jgi:hypothetical protein
MSSAVSVFVIDCTTIGPAPPTRTWRAPQAMATRRVARRACGPIGIACAGHPPATPAPFTSVSFMLMAAVRVRE